MVQTGVAAGRYIRTMTGEEDRDRSDGKDGARGPLRLHVVDVSGPVDGFLPQVRLLREFKGLRVEDLLADAALAAQLPGRAQSALECIQRGDLAGAEKALPGRFGAVLPGPGHRASLGREGRRYRILFVAVVVAAVYWLLVG